LFELKRVRHLKALLDLAFVGKIDSELMELASVIYMN
jgi:hypothetical protein